MKLSQFKQHLGDVSQLNFLTPSGNPIPKHFHITEAGLATKHFVDCGGTLRTEKNVSIQLWVANDYDHRLEPQKLKRIIGIAEKQFDLQGLEVEVEYQAETIGRFGLGFDGQNFLLTPKHTDCLAQELCGIAEAKPGQESPSLQTSETAPCCPPGGGCC